MMTPSAGTLPNGEVTGNADAAVSYFYFLGSGDYSGCHPDVVVFHVYVDALVASESVKADPRSMDQILWDAGGADLDVLMSESPAAPMSVVFATISRKARAWSKGGAS